MFRLFKRETPGQKAEQAQKEQSIDRVVRSVERQKNELIDEIRRAREKRLLREALGGNGE